MTEVDRRSFITQAGGTVAAFTLLPRFTTAAPRPDGEPMPVGVIGIGRQGRRILQELQALEAVAVVAYCDSDERRLRSARRSAPQGAEACGDHRALLDRPDIKAVFISTPTHLHRQVAIDALQAGKHVYCEAPLASTIEDCSAIAQAARGAGTVFQTGFQGRSNPIYKLARSFYRSDALRNLVSLRAQDFRKTMWRTEISDPQRNRLMNWRLDPEVSIGLAGQFGSHQFDAIHWFIDQYPTRVSGSGGVRLHDDGREVPDTVQCDLTFPGGLHLHYQATLASSYGQRNEVYHGSDATIKLAWTAGWMFKEADAPTQDWEVYAIRQQFHNDEGITLIADATKLAAQDKLKEGVRLPNSPLYYAIADFLTSVLENQPVVCSADEGLRATTVGILANRSVLTGEVIEFDETILKGS